MRRVSTTQSKSTNQEQIQLQEQEAISDTASESGTYIESETDSHNYEFLSNHDGSPQAIDMTDDNQSPINDDISYEHTLYHPNVVKHFQNN